MKRSKAQALSNLQSLIVPIIGIAIVLVIGFLIFAQAKTQVVDLITAQTTANETVVWVNNTYVTLTNSVGSADVSCSSVINDSNGTGTTVPPALYDCTIDGFRLQNNNSAWNTSVWVNYSYKPGSYAYNATGETQNAIADIPGWLPIIIVTIIGAILLSLVALFTRRQ